MNKEIINCQKNTIHRLQQECTEKTNAIIALGERLQAKEQECKELKEQFKLAEPLYQSCNIKDRKIKKYEQTLAEIKEIANKTLWTYSNLDDVTKYNMFDNILQKISEVKDDNA